MIDAPEDPIPMDAAAVKSEPVVDAAPIATVIVCPNCARTLAVESGVARFATGADTAALSEDEQNALRATRRKAVIPPARNRK